MYIVLVRTAKKINILTWNRASDFGASPATVWVVSSAETAVARRHTTLTRTTGVCDR